MNNLSEISIEDKIYKIRGVQVMLDSDLAELYHVETKRVDELFDKFNSNDIAKKSLLFLTI